jgi:uncharacterized protein YciI
MSCSTEIQIGRSRVGVEEPATRECRVNQTSTGVYYGFFTRTRCCGKLTVMFVIELVYKAPLEEIDAHMAAHVAFLKKHYTAGNFLISGRKVPRDGGIIVAAGTSKLQIETIIQEDPFYRLGLADFRVVEFRASQRADDIQKRIDDEAAASGRRRPQRH